MKSKSAWKLSILAIGIALYVALSMSVKIPIISNIGLDLGYIVLAVYCYYFGGIYGIIIGGCGCALVSLITSGWFPPGWFIGNIFIGYVCGQFFRKEDKFSYFNIFLIVFSVIIGIVGIKTLIECLMFHIPWIIKIEKNAIAAFVDIVVMVIGLIISPKLKNVLKYQSG